MKRNKIKDHKSKIRLAIMSILALILLLVFIILFQKSNTSNLDPTSAKDPKLNLGISISNNQTSSSSLGNNLSPEFDIPTPHVSESTISKNNDGGSNIETPGGGVEIEAIACSSDKGLFCEVYEDDAITTLLDNNPFIDGVTIDGKKFEVSKIMHQLTFVNKSRNVITGFGGEVLTSSDVTYQENTKLLTIYIAIDKRYYQSLGLSEKRTAYKSQLVRELFDLTGSSTTNYPKLLSVVSKLAGWNPK